jgi:vacuolar protein sorting-associated protein 29
VLQCESWQSDGHFFLNPGSATGAFSCTDPETVPSFALMDMQTSSIVTYLYQLVGDEVKVEKLEFAKA